MQINAEKSPYLTEKLRIFMLPTLALVKKEKVVDYVVGFDELGGTDDFSTEVVFLTSSFSVRMYLITYNDDVLSLFTTKDSEQLLCVKWLHLKHIECLISYVRHDGE